MSEAAISEIKTKSDCLVLVLLDVCSDMIEDFRLKFDDWNMHEVDFLIVEGIGYVLFDYSHISSRVGDVFGLDRLETLTIIS